MPKPEMTDDEIDECAVRVCVRVRPLSEMEHQRGDVPNATVLSDDRTIRIKVETEGRRKIETHHYQFDHCFDGSSSQIEVFHDSGAEAYCDSALSGFISTIFCFGQTGSGKTYTMSGPVADGETCVASGLAADPDSIPQLGIQYRAAHYMARQAAHIAASQDQDVVLKASFVEIYNESVNDLLQDKEGLRVRWSQSAQSFFIEDLMIVRCDSVDDLLAVLEEGNTNRKRASHRLNIDSSRSHVVFTVYVERKARGSRAPPKLGKINFIDLAGSERLRDSGSTGVNAQETKSINKSLFALGNVIQSLASRKDAAFIPYRDSTLTKLLMDSLGGSCKTLMIACITPSVVYTEESVSTLKYATRTSNIINAKPKVRTDPQAQLVYELRQEIELLKQENAALKARLGGGGGGTPPNLPGLAPSPTPAFSDASSFLRGAQGNQRIVRENAPPALSITPTEQRRDFNDHFSPPNVSPSPGPSRPTPSSRSTPLEPLQHQPRTPPESNATPLNAQSLATLEIAERVQRDNERLREEVAQLRNLVLSSRASSPAKSRREPSQSFDPPPGTANGSMDSGFGFRPAPKRINQLASLPMSDANNTQMTTLSAPNMPVSQRVQMGQTSYSSVSATNPSPSALGRNGSMAGMVGARGPPAGSQAEYQDMRRRLEQAQRDMLLAKLQNSSGAF